MLGRPQATSQSLQETACSCLLADIVSRFGVHVGLGESRAGERRFTDSRSGPAATAGQVPATTLRPASVNQ
jgi:hypothetical protein